MADPHHYSDTDGEGVSVQDPMTREDWEELPADPDLNDDLGYEMVDLESYEAEGDRILFLPTDEDMLREDAFIVAGQEDMDTLRE